MPEIKPGNAVRCAECGWGFLVDDGDNHPSRVLAHLQDEHDVAPENAEAHVTDW